MLEGFNRYMVECECDTGYFIIILMCVLIDTWWNVNAEKLNKALHISPVLIDTWWNVNVILVTL